MRRSQIDNVALFRYNVYIILSVVFENQSHALRVLLLARTDDQSLESLSSKSTYLSFIGDREGLSLINDVFVRIWTAKML